jgi:hypothetical protein
MELRWITRLCKYPDPQVDPADRYAVEVLQYRFRVHPDISTTGDTGWQDVPHGGLDAASSESKESK